MATESTDDVGDRHAASLWDLPDDYDHGCILCGGDPPHKRLCGQWGPCDLGILFQPEPLPELTGTHLPAMRSSPQLGSTRAAQ